MKSLFNRRFFFRLLIFGYLWLMVGFMSGTVILIGPVHWITDFLRLNGWPQDREDLVIQGVIACFVIFSAWFSWRLGKIVFQTRSVFFRLGIPFAAGLFAGGALYFWMNPALSMRFLPQQLSHRSGFTFGPYPSENSLRELKRQGYTAVISLLHPAVIPFEPKLIEEEEAAAKKVGIPLINIPMLPWVSKNEDALEKIRELSRGKEGLYYVHCYLGTDRVNVVKRVVEQIGLPVTAENPSENGRKISDIQKFERGKIHRLDNQVYLTPYPTEEELLTYILNGSVQTVVSLMDPGKNDEAKWIEREKTILQKYNMPFILLSIPANPNSPKVLEAVKKVRELPRPLVVHHFRSDSSVAETFLKAYEKYRPAAPETQPQSPLPSSQAR